MDEWSIDLWFQEALSRRALKLPAKCRKSNCQKPRVPEHQTTSQEGRAIDPLRHSRGVVLEKPTGLASPGTAVLQGHARQETAKPSDNTGIHVTIARALIGERRSVADVKH